MEGYICTVCKNKHKDGETFYPVLTLDEKYVTTCSIECFNIEKNKQLENAKKKLKDLEEQMPIIEIW